MKRPEKSTLQVYIVQNCLFQHSKKLQCNAFSTYLNLYNPSCNSLVAIIFILKLTSFKKLKRFEKVLSRKLRSLNPVTEYLQKGHFIQNTSSLGVLARQTWTVIPCVISRPVGRFFCGRVRSNEETDQTCARGSSLKRDAGACSPGKFWIWECILYVLEVWCENRPWCRPWPTLWITLWPTGGQFFSKLGSALL